MSELEVENEEVVIEHPPEGGLHHVHSGRPVLCKKGTAKLTLEPMLKAQSETTIGHDKRHNYVRTTDVDSSGRAIFRPEGV